VRGVGLVLGGTVITGRIEVNDQVMVGPDRRGDYTLIQVISIHHSISTISTKSILNNNNI